MPRKQKAPDSGGNRPGRPAAELGGVVRGRLLNRRAVCVRPVHLQSVAVPITGAAEWLGLHPEPDLGLAAVDKPFRSFLDFFTAVNVANLNGDLVP